MRLIYIVAAIEGFATLAIQIIALRLAAPVVGSSSITTSVFIGVILLALSAGYWQGGKMAARMSKERISFVVGIYLLFAACWYLLVSVAFEQSLLQFMLDMTGSYLFTLFSVVVLLFFLPIFIASQTVPLLTELLPGSSKGESAGALLFASTIGSFFGSVLTSIVFFQAIGVWGTAVFVTVFLICSVIVWWRKTHPHLLWICVLLLCLILTGVVWHRTYQEKNIYAFDSAYQSIRIVEGYEREGRPIRVYKTNDAFASAIFTDSKESPFAYMQEAIQQTVNLSPEHVLMIGGAGFSFPYEVDKKIADIQRIDVVDVDPAVEHVAEEYFLQTSLSQKVVFIPSSARYVLHDKIDHAEIYDVIFIDAFHGKAIPGELTTQEFFLDIQRLIPQGTLLVNAILDTNLESDLAQNLLATMQHVFGKVRIKPTTSTDNADIHNFIIATQPLSSEYTLVRATGNIYTDDKRSTDMDTVALYW